MATVSRSNVLGWIDGYDRQRDDMSIGEGSILQRSADVAALPLV
jgi:hypothetical protein